ncbi:MAG: glycosyltransferase [Nitrospirota bacterium]|nr:glycosyltransferase [Nitrospirota bacterium]
MRVIVFDVPASESGALEILESFFNYVNCYERKDIEWLFIVSTDKLNTKYNNSNVSVLRFSFVKKNWFERLRFEIFKVPSLLKNYNADVVFSLQNIASMHSNKVPQVIYVHQSLPYVSKNFSYLKKNERFLAFYADIFRVLIGWSVRKAVSVIVQTSWFKEALVMKHGISANKITIIPPSLDIYIPAEDVHSELSEFFYPATPYVYKNVFILVEAVRQLKDSGFSPKIFLTMTGSENLYARELGTRIRKLGLSEYFSFIGRITREEVFRLYRRTTLLFPSRLESYGLPLLEARIVETSIIASDTPFAREILEGYSKVCFCDESDAAAFAEAMKTVMSSQKIVHSKFVVKEGVQIKTPTRWGEVVDLLIAAGS